MALHRPGSAHLQGGFVVEMNGDHWPSGSQRPASILRHDGKSEHKNPAGSRQGRQGEVGYEGGKNVLLRREAGKAKRSVRISRTRQCSMGLFVLLLLSVVAISILGGDFFFSRSSRSHFQLSQYEKNDFLGRTDDISGLHERNNRGYDERTGGTERRNFAAGEIGLQFLRGRDSEKRLSFGQNVKGQEDLGQDSRAWDSDDRDRSSLTELSNGGDESVEMRKDSNEAFDEDVDEGNVVERELFNGEVEDLDNHRQNEDSNLNSGLYNEEGRKELRMYEEQFEAALKQELSRRAHLKSIADLDEKTTSNPDEKEDVDASRQGKAVVSAHANAHNVTGSEVKASVSEDDEYDDDGGESETVKKGSDAVSENDQEEAKSGSEQGKDSGHDVRDSVQDVLAENSTTAVLLLNHQEDLELQKIRLERHMKMKKKPRAVPCEIAFANSTTDIIEPEDDLKFENFSLRYVEREELPAGDADWEPRFAGHQTMAEREKSFHATSQTLHCGFVQGPNGSASTGFEMSDEDKEYLSSCRIAVSSCIFNNSDHIRSPLMKKVSNYTKKNTCFVMFVDQSTLDVMVQEDQGPNAKGRVGLWKVVVVKNMPFSDGRRTGKVPKLLTHRLFPSARYSIWLDSKLRLQTDPILILEYFLWRRGAEYAISNHYDRHDVEEEVLQNKKLNKFNHTIIDQQFRFYQQDGLTRFNASDPKKILPSYVPEGSFIVRAHTPLSNLFSCLWFNEVDRFTPRDQLSFAYTYMKLSRMNPQTTFSLHMFKDCERKTLAKLFRHRHEDKVTEVMKSTRIETENAQ